MTKKSRIKNRTRSQKDKTFQIQLIGFFIVVATIGAIIYFSVSEPAPEQASDRLELDPVLGNPDAPITVVEYGAYGCEACRAWHEAEIVDLILEQFPTQVKFIYRDMPIILPAWSQDMAEVAQCALDQSNDAFWLMHNALFTRTAQGRTTQQEAIRLGEQLGLDTNALQTCVDNNTHQQTVIYDMNRGEAQGIRGTPTWFVNGQRIFNASPAILQQTILNELANLEG